jgi:hypothetical protein
MVGAGRLHGKPEIGAGPNAVSQRNVRRGLAFQLNLIHAALFVLKALWRRLESPYCAWCFRFDDARLNPKAERSKP